MILSKRHIYVDIQVYKYVEKLLEKYTTNLKKNDYVYRVELRRFFYFIPKISSIL